MTKNEYMDYAEKELKQVVEIIKAKNADYTSNSSDPFENFKVCEKLGLSDSQTGVLIRMVDKIQRVKSFIANNDLKVKNESVQDALNDIIGYSLILKGMFKDKETPAKVNQTQCISFNGRGDVTNIVSVTCHTKSFGVPSIGEASGAYFSGAQ